MLLDEIGVDQLADRILKNTPLQGYSISNALQWRLQYSRVIKKVGAVSGILRVR